MSVDLRRWLAGRRPEPPAVMAGWLDVEAGVSDVPWTSLAATALDALGRARATPGRVRESAYHLLRADALLTYACEAALESPDPESVLRGILRTVGGRGR